MHPDTVADVEGLDEMPLFIEILLEATLQLIETPRGLTLCGPLLRDLDHLGLAFGGHAIGRATVFAQLGPLLFAHLVVLLQGALVVHDELVAASEFEARVVLEQVVLFEVAAVADGVRRQQLPLLLLLEQALHMILVLKYRHTVLLAVPRVLLVQRPDGVPLRLEADLVRELLLHLQAHVANIGRILLRIVLALIELGDLIVGKDRLPGRATVLDGPVHCGAGRDQGRVEACLTQGVVEGAADSCRFIGDAAADVIHVVVDGVLGEGACSGCVARVSVVDGAEGLFPVELVPPLILVLPWAHLLIQMRIAKNLILLRQRLVK